MTNLCPNILNDQFLLRNRSGFPLGVIIELNEVSVQ